MSVYVDTSALAKRYISERGSDAFDTSVVACQTDRIVSQLGSTEFESVLQRLSRQGYLSLQHLQQARRDFSADLGATLWVIRPFLLGSFTRAAELMRTLNVPLATLDALHLASALDFGCDAFATSARQLSLAAARSGLTVHEFFS